ncbi:hypothetical protein JHK82_047690 [Glycine max]|nr:hypothetical protein JHK86_047580 [Glycine max]KAG4943529.1 hypothetical protein JHK85_048175 [Glycine max]KAG5097836.1 hypothetical protein JHK82_047690 [Glycine max]
MSNILACYQLLELNVISAQDLAQMDRSMQTYAVAWIDPDHKLSTRVDSQGGTNPTWNDNSMKSKPLGYNHDNLIKPSHPVMLELHHTKSDYSSMLSSEAIARKHQAKAKKG